MSSISLSRSPPSSPSSLTSYSSCSTICSASLSFSPNATRETVPVDRSQEDACTPTSCTPTSLTLAVSAEKLPSEANASGRNTGPTLESVKKKILEQNERLLELDRVGEEEGGQSGKQSYSAAKIFQLVEWHALQQKVVLRVPADDVAYVLHFASEEQPLTAREISEFLTFHFPQCYGSYESNGKTLERDIINIIFACHPHFHVQFGEKCDEPERISLTRQGRICYREYSSVTKSIVDFRHNFGPFVPFAFQVLATVAFSGEHFFYHEDAFIAYRALLLLQQRDKYDQMATESEIFDILTDRCEACQYSEMSMSHPLRIGLLLSRYNCFEHHTVTQTETVIGLKNDVEEIDDAAGFFEMMRKRQAFLPGHLHEATEALNAILSDLTATVPLPCS